MRKCLSRKCYIFPRHCARNTSDTSCQFLPFEPCSVMIASLRFFFPSFDPSHVNEIQGTDDYGHFEPPTYLQPLLAHLLDALKKIMWKCYDRKYKDEPYQNVCVCVWTAILTRLWLKCAVYSCAVLGGRLKPRLSLCLERVFKTPKIS